MPVSKPKRNVPIAAKKATPSVYRSGPMVGSLLRCAASIGCCMASPSVYFLSFVGKGRRWCELASPPITLMTGLQTGKRAKREGEVLRSREGKLGGIPTLLYDLQDPPITASWHLALQKPSESHVQYLTIPPATRSEPNQAGK